MGLRGLEGSSEELRGGSRGLKGIGEDVGGSSWGLGGSGYSEGLKSMAHSNLRRGSKWFREGSDILCGGSTGCLEGAQEA